MGIWGYIGCKVEGVGFWGVRGLFPRATALPQAEAEAHSPLYKKPS